MSLSLLKPPWHIKNLVHKLVRAYASGRLDIVRNILLELDQWAASVDSAFVLDDSNPRAVKLLLCGAFKAEWTFAAGRGYRNSSQHCAQQVAENVNAQVEKE